MGKKLNTSYRKVFPYHITYSKVTVSREKWMKFKEKSSFGRCVVVQKVGLFPKLVISPPHHMISSLVGSLISILCVGVLAVR